MESGLNSDTQQVEVLPEEIVAVPVFVDSTGKRKRRFRTLGFVAGGVGVAYAAMLGLSFAGGPIAPNSLLPVPGMPTAAPLANTEPESSMSAVSDEEIAREDGGDGGDGEDRIASTSTPRPGATVTPKPGQPTPKPSATKPTTKPPAVKPTTKPPAATPTTKPPVNPPPSNPPPSNPPPSNPPPSNPPPADPPPSNPPPSNPPPANPPPADPPAGGGGGSQTSAPADPPATTSAPIKTATPESSTES
ncbi:hypothetical protein GCM10020369_60130 [Cryptosporangium minutisporangium]|uniref:Uncharacterized protein n=1 Tax=Cryptosporangium minutisporangium TaxID=113569 RepID=A0ABP6T5E7_9ACTN